MATQQTGRVRIEEGVEFGSGGGRPLRCDVFHPPEPGEHRPGVLLLHGGGWRTGDRSQLRGYGILLGRLGFVCVASEYRLTGEALWPAQIHDVKAALRWMRAESGALGIDPHRISVSGNSAGGHLALMLAGTSGRPEFEGEGGSPGVSTECSAVIAFYPPTRLGSALRASGEVAGLGLFEPDTPPEVIEAASPLSHVSKEFPPTLLLHGNRDQLVPTTASLQMYAALAEAGAPAELHVFNDAPHGFDAGRELGRTCAQLMALFLERHVTSPKPV